MSELVKVIVRVRPVSEKEEKLKCQDILRIENSCELFLGNPTDKKAPEKQFVFDSVYDGKSTNDTIYGEICYSLVDSVLDGYNSTIFAYGQTGCGKSFTMQGPTLTKIIENEDNALESRKIKVSGIISCSFDHLFEAMSVANDVRYLVLVSYLEIYNETIRDLMSNDDLNNNLKLKENPTDGVVVDGLSRHPVQNIQDCENLLLFGAKNRKVGFTQMNAGSSRSHSIFQIQVEQISDAKPDENCNIPVIRKGKLNLVDLAGSERANKTGATGDRMKEATKINLSLSALGNVISALVDGKTKHVPYRDSKLTRLLQDSLGGNTKTLMIACVSPVDYNYEETLSTLRYASRAKNIQNKPRINEDPKDAMLREYQNEIEKLKEILKNSSILDVHDTPKPNVLNVEEQIRNEKDKLSKEFEEKVKSIKHEHDQHKREKEELIQNMTNLKKEYEEKLRKMEKFAAQETDVGEENEEIRERIKSIKDILVGGEKANDSQLKEKRYKKKLVAQKKNEKTNTVNNLLNRFEGSEDRDLLQAHYEDIHQGIKVKNEILKQSRHKIRLLEREIIDIQAEFQLDRADYLETIRRLEKRNKFYEQFFEKISPVLKRDGRVWNIDAIKAESVWNDDLKKWKIPDNLLIMLHHLKLPPAIDTSRNPSSSSETSKNRENSNAFTAPGRLECLSGSDDYDHESFGTNENLEKRNDVDLALTYFKPKRIERLIHETKAWKEYAQNNLNARNPYEDPQLNKTWVSGMGNNFFQKASSHLPSCWNLNPNTKPKPVW